MNDAPDGTELTNGIVVFNKQGHCDAVYRCRCGREQAAQHDGYPGGISIATAEQVGWRRIDGKWRCPFCTGNMKHLQSIFKE